MALTELQEQFNDDPRYWLWFEKWWNEDYSWDGLDSKETLSGEPLKATYTQYVAEIHLVEAFERKWHPLNLPPHDLSGNIIDEGLVRLAKPKAKVQLNQIEEIHGCVWPANTLNNLSNDKLLKCVYCQTSGIKNSGIGAGGLSRHIIHTNNCYVDLRSQFPALYENSIIVSSEFGCKPFDSHPREDLPRRLTFKNCTLEKHTTIKVSNGISVSIVGSDTAQLNIYGANIKLLNLTAKYIRIYITQGGGFVETTEYNYNCDITLEKTSDAFLTIEGNKSHKHPEGRIAVNIGSDNQLHLLNLEVSNPIFSFDTLKLLQIENSHIHSRLELGGKAIDKLVLRNSLFANGIFAEDFSTLHLCKIEGIISLKINHFVSSDFSSGLKCTSYENFDGELINSKISSANFTASRFKRSVDSGYSCVTFNNTEFLDHAIFDEVEFNGVPRFHDTTLPKDTSFDHLKKNADFEDANSDGDAKIEKYGHYLRAYRSLRQLMENNNNSAAAFMFGKLEMISKLKRGVTTEVRREELFFNKWYGKLADYGQDFLQPLKCLFLVYLVSLLYQFFVFSITKSECWLWENRCRINGDIFGEAFERGTIFLLPPFTMLINRSIDENTKQIFNWDTDLLSGFGILCHAVAATLLLFLFGLSVKRKMQIK